MATLINNSNELHRETEGRQDKLERAVFAMKREGLWFLFKNCCSYRQDGTPLKSLSNKQPEFCRINGFNEKHIFTAGYATTMNASQKRFAFRDLLEPKIRANTSDRINKITNLPGASV